jgi:hypothetical protein
MMTSWASFVKSNCGIAVFIFFYLGITSCTTLISDEFPEYDQEPVLNSILIAYQPIEAHLSFAEKIDTTELVGTGNATVYFSSDPTDMQAMSGSDSGFFFSDHLLVPGEIVELNAMVPDFEDISAKDTIPVSVQIDITDHTNRAKYSDEGYYMAGITIQFTDNPEKEDYYELMLSRRTDDRTRNLYAFNDQLDILLNEGIDPYSTSSLLFSDELFKDDVVKMSLNFNPGGSSRHCSGMDSCYQVFDTHTLIAELRHVSLAYYQYKKQFYFYEKTREVEFIDGIATTISNYSNVNNGRGIVAAYTSIVDSVHVPADSVLHRPLFY